MSNKRAANRDRPFHSPFLFYSIFSKVLSAAQVIIEHVEESGAFLCFFESRDVVAGVDFFFNLFGDVPLEEDFGFQIAFFAGKFNKAADGSGNSFFVSQRVFSDIQRIVVVFLDTFNRKEVDGTVSVFNVINEFQGVFSFFFILFVQPFCIAVQCQIFMSWDMER